MAFQQTRLPEPPKKGTDWSLLIGYAAIFSICSVGLVLWGGLALLILNTLFRLDYPYDFIHWVAVDGVSLVVGGVLYWLKTPVSKR